MLVENTVALPTSKGHQWLSLTGVAFVLFEVVFVELYSNRFWFGFNLVWWGVPAVLSVLICGHFLLQLAESKLGCRLAYFVLKGKPPMVYRRWVKIEEGGFSFGLRHIRWQVIDAVALTWLGNLEIKSRVICGDMQESADLIFKIPFSAAGQGDQRRFVAALRSGSPRVRVNQRLTKRLESPVVRGQNFVQAMGGAIMFVLLLDLGYSSFYYLELLKHYYLSEIAAISGDLRQADKQLAEADYAFAHPLPFSYITTRFLSSSSCAAGIATVKADALWHANRKKEALSEAKRAVDLAPQTSRVRLHYVRLLEETGATAQARGQLSRLIDKHKDWLLPRLYLLANVHDTKPDNIGASYKAAMNELSDALFYNEPAWPPGGETFAHDWLYSADIYFVFNRLLAVDAKRQFKTIP